MPAEPAGAYGISGLAVNPDGRSYVYTLGPTLSDLYLSRTLSGSIFPSGTIISDIQPSGSRGVGADWHRSVMKTDGDYIVSEESDNDVGLALDGPTVQFRGAIAPVAYGPKRSFCQGTVSAGGHVLH